jgi:acetyl-CoA acetyltransferase
MGGQQGRQVVIVEAVRTPIGRGHFETGYCKDAHPTGRLGATHTAVLERTGVEASAVEDVIAGCEQQLAEQSMNVARNAWLQTSLEVC